MLQGQHRRNKKQRFVVVVFMHEDAASRVVAIRIAEAEALEAFESALVVSST